MDLRQGLDVSDVGRDACAGRIGRYGQGRQDRFGRAWGRDVRASQNGRHGQGQRDGFSELGLCLM